MADWGGEDHVTRSPLPSVVLSQHVDGWEGKGTREGELSRREKERKRSWHFPAEIQAGGTPQTLEMENKQFAVASM